jgi:alpha-1,2-mannosyltransferase
MVITPQFALLMPIIVLQLQDMLKKVRDQRPSYNNASVIASSVTISSLKLLYYKVFAAAYSWAGRHARVVMVNSSWTRNHVRQLWWGNEGPTVTENAESQPEASRSGDGDSTDGTGRTLALVYPPCNTTELLAMGTDRDAHHGAGGGKQRVTRRGSKTGTTEKRIVLSIGQFRPEKDHLLQIRAIQCLLERDQRYGTVQYLSCAFMV